MHKFEQVFIDDTKNGSKIPTSDYSDFGKYQIIDQGQNEVGGYTDIEDGLYENIPVVVFGDHTRAIKYVSEPFFIGADGVKILKALNENNCVKYLYYYLLSKKIENTGYNRHFKWLKEMTFEIPPISVQQQIAYELDTVCSAIAKQKKQLKLCDTLIKSKFSEMFNEITDKVLLKNVSKIITGGTPSTKEASNFKGNIPWITTVALGKLIIDKEDAIKYITQDAVNHSSTKLIPKNSLLFGIRVGVGKCSINAEPICTNQDIASIVNLEANNMNSIFVKFALETFVEYFNQQKRGATIQGITTEVLKNIAIPKVPLALQQQFADFVNQVEQNKTKIKQALSNTETLYKALMQKYFA